MTDTIICAVVDTSFGSPSTEAGTVSRICPMLGKGQQPGHQRFPNENAFSFNPQRLTRLQQEPTMGPQLDFPPGFRPAVRLHSAQEFPALGTEPSKTREPKATLSNSTSAAGQRSFSLAAAKRSQNPPLPTFSKILTRTPSSGPPHRATSTPPGVAVGSPTTRTLSLPVNSHTAGADTDSQQPSSNDAPAPTGPAFLAKSEVMGVLPSRLFHASF